MKRKVTLQDMNLQEPSDGLARLIGRNKTEQPERQKRARKLNTERYLTRTAGDQAEALRKMGFQVL